MNEYKIHVESRMCHPETCCCESHGIYVIRDSNYSFVSRHENKNEAISFAALLNAHNGGDDHE